MAVTKTVALEATPAASATTPVKAAAKKAGNQQIGGKEADS